jgi:hypothetical protein
MSRKMRSLQTFKVHRARATVRRWLQQIELSGLALSGLAIARQSPLA